MEESLVTQVTRYLKSQRRRKIGYQILTCMASVVVFCTVYALILPAITISNELTCALEQHEHDENCYTMAPAAAQPELICDTTELPGLVLHTHNQFCYDNDDHLICTLTEREAHTHGRSCYQEHLNLICNEVQVMGHAHTGACYARERGELVCTEEEGAGAHTHTDGCLSVTEKEVLSCGKTEEPAHTHDESCYTTRTKETLVCGEREESAHTHDSSCYTTTTSQTLVCTESEGPDEVDEEGNVISSGHSHSAGCYETEEETSLTCMQEETAGHSHSAGCYETEEETVLSCTLQESTGHSHDESCYKTETETTVLCGQEEGAGHVHGDSCYEWTERLTCTEEESPAGHIHGDECYETETVLACRQMEMEEHVHGEGCYNVEGELTCTRREISSHQHTADCVFIPESTGEEVLTLTCGLEEHIHNETCYVDIVPPEDQEFFCGFPAHTHTEECYFEDGVTLRCTVPEHIHTEECREPPMPEEPKYTGAEGVELDNEFTYEDDAFLVTFHITGYAPLLYDEEPIVMEDNSFYSAGPLSEEPAGPVGGTETAGEAEPAPETVPGPVEEPEASDEAAEYEDGGADNSFGGFVGDEGFTFAGDPTEGAVPLNPEDVTFTVETLSEDSREYRRMASHAEEYNDNAELPMLEVLTFSAEIDGQELDLSGCTVEVEITLSELLVEYLNSYSESQAMAIPEDGVFDEGMEGAGESDEDSGFLLMTYSLERGSDEVNEIGAVNTAEESRVSGQMGANDENKVVIALLPRVYPNYEVEYYANILQPVVGTQSNDTLPFIDTTGRNLPKNDSTPAVKWIQLGEETTGGKRGIAFEEVLQPIYRTQSDLYFNPKEESEGNPLTVKRLNAIANNHKDGGSIEETSLSSHYDVAELWVLQPGRDENSEDPETGWKKYVSSELDPVNGVDLEALRFTNNREAADQNENLILLQDIEEGHTKLRLVYNQNNGDYNNAVGFYDYDISQGPSTARPVKTNINGAAQGINSPSNYKSGGQRYAFGNSNTGTGLGGETTGSYYINQANKSGGKVVYKGCSFGIVNGLNSDGSLRFNSLVSAPALFDGTWAVGKTVHPGHQLEFIRQGDTYTLSAVSDTGTQGLESLGHPGNHTDIWTNDFWPMDGYEGNDPHFGVPKQVQYNEGGEWKTLPESDDGQNHNAYFGMKFSIDFTLSKEYIGPLEYYFYGDDDLWVFLDGELVCDIGGVHSSVGEYVNLWDYIDKDDRTTTMPHRLEVFYTERGASGSTCWMQYTLPNAVSVPVSDLPTDPEQSLRIEKKVEGNLEIDPEMEYTFSIILTGNMNEEFQANRYDSAGKLLGNHTVSCTSETRFKLKAGEYLIVEELPERAGFELKELLDGAEYDAIRDSCYTTIDITTTKDGVSETQTVEGTSAGTNLGGGSIAVTVTNGFNFELPETGGNGTLLYTLTGALLPVVTGGLWYRKRKSKGEGAVD